MSHSRNYGGGCCAHRRLEDCAGSCCQEQNDSCPCGEIIMEGGGCLTVKIMEEVVVLVEE